MVSQHYKSWISIEDEHRCVECEEMHGQIYEIDELPKPKPPLHENCRCYITLMKAILAGEATKKGKTGADWWLIKYGSLPPYYLSGDEAKDLGWIARFGNLSVIAPGKMVAMGEYGNRNGHLPKKEGRVWYEADINYESGFRNKQRIVYSSDGLVFVTYDHYRTFVEVVSEER